MVSRFLATLSSFSQIGTRIFDRAAMSALPKFDMVPLYCAAQNCTIDMLEANPCSFVPLTILILCRQDEHVVVTYTALHDSFHVFEAKV